MSPRFLGEDVDYDINDSRQKVHQDEALVNKKTEKGVKNKNAKKIRSNSRIVGQIAQVFLSGSNGKGEGKSWLICLRVSSPEGTRKVWSHAPQDFQYVGGSHGGGGGKL